MIVAAFGDTFRHKRQLWADDGCGEIAQAEIVKWKTVLPAREGGLKGFADLAMLAPVVFIGARHDYGLGEQIGIIGDENAAFASVDELVRLEGKAADASERADVLAVPCGSEAVSSVFNDGNIACLTQRHDGVHIGGVAAHMRDDHSANIVCKLGLEIDQIDTIVVTDFTKHRQAVRMDNRGGHGGKRKGRNEHAGVAWQAERFEREKECSRA